MSQSSAFKKTTNPAQPATNEVREQKPAEYFINLGIRKTYADGTERFVQIPVTIPVYLDRIDEMQVKTGKRATANSPEEWQDFIEDSLVLGEDFKALLNELGKGEGAHLKDIPEDHDFSYMHKVEIQIFRKDMDKPQRTTEITEDVKKDRRSRF